MVPRSFRPPGISGAPNRRSPPGEVRGNQRFAPFDKSVARRWGADPRLVQPNLLRPCGRALLELLRYPSLVGIQPLGEASNLRTIDVPGFNQSRMAALRDV